MTFQDIITSLDKDKLIFHIAGNIEYEKEIIHSAILFSHELTRTGAPVVLLNMARVLLNKGYLVIIVCDEDGELREEILKEGISVIIYSSYEEDQSWIDSCSTNFEFILANTLVCSKCVSRLSVNSQKTIYWWIHENELIFKYLYNQYKDVALKGNVKVLSAGPYVQTMVQKYMNISSDVLNFFIPDEKNNIELENDKITFLNVGTIDGLKGQDVLVDAIRGLPNEVREKAEFLIVGKVNTNQMELINKIQKVLTEYSNVKYIPTLPRKELLELYNVVESVIVASKVEPTSAIMVEGLMKGKIGICSDVCGICQYLQNDVNALIFKNGDVRELTSKIIYVVNNYKNMDTLRKNGRLIYEQVYSEAVFIKNIERLLV